MTDKTKANKITPLAAKLTGYGGGGLFVLTGINLLIGWPLFSGFALQVFVVYSALILSFLGGVRWGLALIGTVKSIPLCVAVLPNLYALGCLLLNQPLHQITALAVGFIAMLLLDWFVPPLHMPTWMVRLRLHLGLIVIIAHVLAWVAVFQWV